MYLCHQPSGDLVEILDLYALFNPLRTEVSGRLHVGEELQEPEPFAKSDLTFPSGEALPRCWRDPRYRD
jgi:hypothetical protein